MSYYIIWFMDENNKGENQEEFEEAEKLQTLPTKEEIQQDEE